MECKSENQTLMDERFLAEARAAIDAQQPPVQIREALINAELIWRRHLADSTVALRGTCYFDTGRTELIPTLDTDQIAPYLIILMKNNAANTCHYIYEGRAGIYPLLCVIVVCRGGNGAFAAHADELNGGTLGPWGITYVPYHETPFPSRQESSHVTNVEQFRRNESEVANTQSAPTDPAKETIQPKNSTEYKVTQIRTITAISKRRTSLRLPDGITPDDINLDPYFDTYFEDAEQEPCEISADWEILEPSPTDYTPHVLHDVKTNLIKDFLVTRDELITLGLDYLERAYDLETPSGYGWDRSDRWNFAYWWERFKQIDDYLAEKDGVPCFEFEAHWYAHEKLLDKIHAMPEWYDLLQSGRWGWSERRNAFDDFLDETARSPLKEQLKNEALARWEKRKGEKQREADEFAGRNIYAVSSTQPPASEG